MIWKKEKHIFDIKLSNKFLCITGSIRLRINCCQHSHLFSKHYPIKHTNVDRCRRPFNGT